MKKKVNGRVKGISAELAAAKLFEEWTGDTVKRSPLSGGWAKEKGFDTSGDLVFVKVKTLHVEVKKNQTWKIEDLLVGTREDDPCGLNQCWSQCVRECPKDEAGNVRKLPLLVFSRNRLEPLVMYAVADLPEFVEKKEKPKGQGRTFIFPWWGVKITTLANFMRRYELKEV